MVKIKKDILAKEYEEKIKDEIKASAKPEKTRKFNLWILLIILAVFISAYLLLKPHIDIIFFDIKNDIYFYLEHIKRA